MFIFLHYLKGTPFQTADQGKARRLTHWEQLNNGEQFTETRKFFTLVPIFLWVCSRLIISQKVSKFLRRTFHLILVGEGGRGKGWRIWEYFPYCSLHISFVTDKERFFNNQELLEWVVTSFILVILMFDSVVITYVEIRC